MAANGRKRSRRQEYAEATRQAIVDAARKLFAERGYFATTVNAIAKEARVAPATVYAVTGGKQGLFDELIKVWTTGPIVEATTTRIVTSTDPVGIIRDVATGTRTMREDWEDIVRLLKATAPHDKAVAERLQQATEVYRAAFLPVAEQLAKLGALKPGMTPADAVDVLWFCFGYSSYFTLHDENGWSYERAERWLADLACRELLAGWRPRKSSSSTAS
jgi:AcrR family transcriptional regulator